MSPFTSPKILFISAQSTSFTDQLAVHLKQPIIPLVFKKFADSENYVECLPLPIVMKKHVVLIFQFFNCQENGSMNDRLIKLFLAINHLKMLLPHRIDLVLPYLPYSRQDTCHCGSKMGPLSMFASFLTQAGVQRIFSYDLHNQTPVIANIPEMVKISCQRTWKEVLTTYMQENPSEYEYCILSPDQGGIVRAQFLAEDLNLACVTMLKERPAPDVTIPLSLEGSVENKNVIIIDDILDTGTTAMHAARVAKEKGAKNIIGCFTHGIFSKDSLEHLKESPFTMIMTTDSLIGSPMHLPFPHKIVSIAPTYAFYLNLTLSWS